MSIHEPPTTYKSKKPNYFPNEATPRFARVLASHDVWDRKAVVISDLTPRQDESWLPAHLHPNNSANYANWPHAGQKSFPSALSAIPGQAWMSISAPWNKLPTPPP